MLSTSFPVSDQINPATTAVPGVTPGTGTALAIIYPTFVDSPSLKRNRTKLSRLKDAKVGASAEDAGRVFHIGVVRAGLKTIMLKSVSS